MESRSAARTLSRRLNLLAWCALACSGAWAADPPAGTRCEPMGGGALRCTAPDGSRVIDCFFAPDNAAATAFSSVSAAHDAIVDQIVELDEALMAKYLDQGESLDPEQLHAPFEQALREGHLVPVCFVSARTGAGVRELLDIRHEDVFERHPSALLECFLLLQQRSELKGMTARTLRALWINRNRVNAAFRARPEHRELFLQILQQKRGIVRVFRKMNEYGILSRYIPGASAETQPLLDRLRVGMSVVAKIDTHRPADAKGVSLPRVERTESADGLAYTWVNVAIDRSKRTATLTVKAPTGAQPADMAGIEALGAAWWPLQMTRELDDAILNLRTNELDIGTWLLKTEGDAQAVLASDATLIAHQDHWLVRETIGALRRTFARLDVSSRSLFALVESGSAFAGSLAELAFAADRTYMLALPDDTERAPKITLNEFNFGLLPMVNDQSRLQRRFYEEATPMEAARSAAGKPLDADAALALGLVTAAPDDIDWDDEIRIAIEERAAMSPDSLTGLEANLRFASKENMNTRIFGRLTAWQNWIFNRPNAVGDKGALKVYGTGQKAGFDLNRV